MAYTLPRCLDRSRMSARNLYFEEGRFSNVYTVWVVPADQRERFEQFFPDAEPMTREEAIRRGWHRPRLAKADGEQWWGGFAEAGGDYPLTVAEAIAGARLATLDELERREWEREMNEAAYG